MSDSLTQPVISSITEKPRLFSLMVHIPHRQLVPTFRSGLSPLVQGADNGLIPFVRLKRRQRLGKLVPLQRPCGFCAPERESRNPPRSPLPQKRKRAAQQIKGLSSIDGRFINICLFCPWLSSLSPLPLLASRLHQPFCLNVSAPTFAVVGTLFGGLFRTALFYLPAPTLRSVTARNGTTRADRFFLASTIIPTPFSSQFCSLTPRRGVDLPMTKRNLKSLCGSPVAEARQHFRPLFG